MTVILVINYKLLIIIIIMFIDQAPKYTGEDLASITSTCFKLNSLQLKALLVKYQPAHDEPRLPHELIDNVVRVHTIILYLYLL